MCIFLNCALILRFLEFFCRYLLFPRTAALPAAGTYIFFPKIFFNTDSCLPAVSPGRLPVSRKRWARPSPHRSASQPRPSPPAPPVFSARTAGICCSQKQTAGHIPAALSPESADLQVDPYHTADSRRYSREKQTGKQRWRRLYPAEQQPQEQIYQKHPYAASRTHQQPLLTQSP